MSICENGTGNLGLVSARRTGLVVALAVCVGTSVQLARSQNTQVRDAARLGSIDQAVADAERRGVSEVVVGGGRIIDWPAVDSLDDVDNDYSIVLIEPVAAMTRKGRYSISTLYTVRVREVLQRQRVTASSTPRSRTVPTLPVVGAGQLLVGMLGGTLAVRGVTVRERGAQLTIGARYLLVIALRPDGQISWPAAGEKSVFTVGPDGTLTPLRDSGLAGYFRSRGVTDLESMRTLILSRSR